MLHMTKNVQFAVVEKQVSKFPSNHLTEHYLEEGRSIEASQT